MKSKQEITDFVRKQRKPENVGDLALKDVRVIDLSTVMAAPFGASLLGDAGAEVIKVENPSAPDAIRSWGRLDNGIEPFWSVIGRNKFPVTINLKDAQGKALLLELVAHSDVMIENLRPGSLEKLGLSPEVLFETNPGLVLCRISGYGQTGPYSSKPGFGTLAEGFSGFSYLNAQPNGVPTNAPLALADYIAGLHVAFAVMVALRFQERNVRGAQVIDISLFEPLFSLLGPDFLSCQLTGIIPEPTGNELTYVAPRNSYKTKDGKWLALSGAAQKPFERLMEVIGHSEMATDPRYSTNEERIKDENRCIINQVIAEWIGSKNRREVIELCNRLGITIGPIFNMEDIAKNEHYQQRGSTVTFEDPVTGLSLQMPNIPYRIHGLPVRIRFPGLPLGSSNEAIYHDLLGHSTDEIKQFADLGAI